MPAAGWLGQWEWAKTVKLWVINPKQWPDGCYKAPYRCWFVTVSNIFNVIDAHVIWNKLVHIIKPTNRESIMIQLWVNWQIYHEGESVLMYDWIEAVTSLLIYHLVSVCAHKKRKEQLFYCFLSPNRGVTFVLRESTRQIERLLSFLFSSWLLVVLQQRVGRRMWQEPLGWEMTVKSGPTFRARTEESLNNHMHSNTTHTHTHTQCRIHAYVRVQHQTPVYQHSHRAAACLKAALTTPAASIFRLQQLREQVDLYTSGLLSAVSVWTDESRAVQTKRREALRDNNHSRLLPPQLFHRCDELFPGHGDSP